MTKNNSEKTGFTSVVFPGSNLSVSKVRAETQAGHEPKGNTGEESYRNAIDGLVSLLSYRTQEHHVMCWYHSQWDMSTSHQLSIKKIYYVRACP